jgi:hypothetical protein
VCGEQSPGDGEYQHFRLFLSAEPSADPTAPASVQPGILQVRQVLLYVLFFISLERCK